MSDGGTELHVTWRQLLARTASATNDRMAARWLCEEASGCEGTEFDSILGEVVGARPGSRLDAMLARHLAGEPLQYVLGRWAFRKVDLKVDRRVLIPRPETELLVEHVMRFVTARRAPRRIVDLGTGTGAIGLSLLLELPLESVTVWMTDSSSDAIDVARANAAGIGRPAVGARFAIGSWFEALDPSLMGTFDVIVSNPPYIADGDAEVDDSVLSWEPHGALFSGADGLDAVRVIIGGARDWLLDGGMLAVEIGHTQGDLVRAMFEDASFLEVTVHRDLAGRDRFVTGLKPVV